MRKVPLRHKDYCSEEAEENEADEDDESLFKSIKVEYTLTDGIKVFNFLVVIFDSIWPWRLRQLENFLALVVLLFLSLALD